MYYTILNFSVLNLDYILSQMGNQLLPIKLLGKIQDCFPAIKFWDFLDSLVIIFI